MLPAANLEKFVFADAGRVPNSYLPLLVYRGVKESAGERLAIWFERTFGGHAWPPAWRYTVYHFTHYHSTCHEVLGVYQGTATLRFGDATGATMEVCPGDVIVIPAGVAHRRLASSADFCAVGAYPAGQQPDLMRGQAGERPVVDANISRVPLPPNDPIFGAQGPLVEMWQNAGPLLRGKEHSVLQP